MAAGDFSGTEDIHGTLVTKLGTVAVPSTYATGGIPLARGSEKFGLVSVSFASVEVTQDADEAWLGKYDYTNDKIQLFGAVAATDALQEMANGVSLTSYVIRVFAMGRKSGNLS